MKYLILCILLKGIICFGQSSTTPALEVGEVKGYEFHWSVGDILGSIANHSVVLMPSNIDFELSEDLARDSLKIEISIYPNPVSSIVNIRGMGLSNIGVVDANGKSQNIHAIETGGDSYVLDVNGLLPGLYFINLDLDSRPMRWKMLVR
ncbi:MAG: T9SS type A sorting domain-containing protein [Marinoscillum sp.]